MARKLTRKCVGKDNYSNSSDNKISMGFKKLSSISLGASNNILLFESSIYILDKVNSWQGSVLATDKWVSAVLRRVSKTKLMFLIHIYAAVANVRPKIYTNKHLNDNGTET